MINFASLFNQFRGGSSSPINDLIDQPETDLDRLLDEDTFVNEYKSGNSKVMSFMKYDKMKALVEYVTLLGPPEDKKKGYKFPLTACDILSSDNSSTVDYFLPTAPLFIEQNVEEQVEVEEEEQIQDDAQNEEQEGENTPKDPAEEAMQNEKEDEEAKETEKQEAEQEQKTEGAGETKKKTVLVKKLKTVNKVTKKEVQPLMDELFNYFKGQVNYTLAGYVSKILVSFFTKKPQQCMKYILEPEKFDCLLSHIESRSVGDFIMKVMTQESTDYLEEREQAFHKMITKLSEKSQIYLISNLSACVCEIIEKATANAKSANPLPTFYKIFFTPEILVKIINNVISEQENVSMYNAPILLTYLSNAPIVLPDDENVLSEFKSLINSFVQKSIQKLKITKESRENLGFGRVKVVEILSFILKENILNVRETVARYSQFFPTLIQTIRNYQMNNILHNQFTKIVNIALNEDYESPLLSNLLEGDYFLNFIMEQSEEDMKIRAGSGKQKSRKGYIGHIISICRKIQENSEKNKKINTLCERPQFQNVLQNLVNKEIYEYNKNLAGYSLKRGLPQTIMFMKEEVIKEHIKFLTTTPPPIFQPEPENINIEHPDLEEAQKASINEVMSKMEMQIESEQEMSEEKFNTHYWKNHIEYKVDQLMNDL